MSMHVKILNLIAMMETVFQYPKDVMEKFSVQTKQVSL